MTGIKYFEYRTEIFYNPDGSNKHYKLIKEKIMISSELKNMIKIPGGKFLMGSENYYPEEKPVHEVTVDGFYIDKYEVTNADYKKFSDETGYITVAERPLDPEEYPTVDPKDLIPGALVFKRTQGPVDLSDYFNWWMWVPGACWKNPKGPESSVNGKEDHPVIHIAYEDAEAYAHWLGKELPSGFPSIGIPAFDLSETGDLFVKSLGIVLISYCSFMLTNKSFAAKNGYQINANQDLYALGFANISSGLSQGFVISGADSRTAVADNAGGKTQMTSIIASLIIIMVLLFFTETLKYLPVAILGAIVISASIGLFNFEYLKNLYLVSRPEFYLAVITSLCVLTIGVLPAVIFAVCLSLLVLLARASKPHDAILGRSVDKNTYIDILEDSGVKSIPGLLIYRFDAQLLFFNADYFRERINHYINKSEDKIDCLIIDAETIVLTDITGAEILSELITGLNNRGVTVYIARSKFKFNSMIYKTGIDKKAKVFRTVHEAADHYLETMKNNS